MGLRSQMVPTSPVGRGCRAASRICSCTLLKARPTTCALLITGYGVLLAGFVNLWITPEGGSIGLQYRRWIWPSGAYLWFAVGVAVAGEVARRTDLRRLADAPARLAAMRSLADQLYAVWIGGLNRAAAGGAGAN